MATQQILFIPVPNGIRTTSGSRRARISVFVSPRLLLDTSNLTGDFLNWPQAMRDKGASFRVQFGNLSKEATIIQQTAPQLWAALFDAKTFVRPHTPDEISGLVGSYPTARLCDLIKTVYQDTFVEAPIEPPTDALPSALAPLRPLFEPAPHDEDGETSGSDDEARLKLAREIFRPSTSDALRAKLDRLVDLAGVEAKAKNENSDITQPTEIIPDVDDAANDLARSANGLARFLQFHSQALGTAPLAPAAADDKRIDFHQQLANLGEYPSLQRRLGLIVELDVDLTGVPLTTRGHGLLRVEPNFTTALSPATTFVTADTAYTLTNNIFRPASGGSPSSEIADGLLNLDLTVGPGSVTPQFRLIQVDVDTAVFEMLSMLRQAGAEGGPRPRSGLATLRSSGVSIVRYGNGQFLINAIGSGLMKMDRIAAGQTGIALFAEDLIRGYRVDVRDRTHGGWTSLHRRDGVYTFTATGNTALLVDEGFLQPSVVQPVTTASTTIAAEVPTYVTESLFLWNGWSLAAPRRTTIMPQPPPIPPILDPTTPIPDPVTPIPDPVSEGKLDTLFTATAGTLPRLRFGHRYDFRVRLADLTGGGVSSAEADSMTPPLLPKSGQEFRYLRFDVVPSPVILPRIEPGLGADVDRIVLRSNHDATPEAYAEQHPEVPEYALSGERHIVAPKGWQLLAEASGLFDSSMGSGADLERTFKLVERATAALGDNEVHPEPLVKVPYLPDPLADGVALSNLPGVPQGALGRVVDGQLQLDGKLLDGPGPVPTSVVAVPFDGVWPDLNGFRLRLREGSGAPQWDGEQRVLSVFLPKGVTRKIGISCTLKDEVALRTLGIWDWLTERLDQLVREGRMDENQRAARQVQLQELSIFGQSWMLTPPRKLTLTHAVQQPVHKPVIERLELVRLPGSTHALINAVIGVHGVTTSQVELRWSGDNSPRPAARAPVLKTPFVLPPVGESSPAPGKPLPVATFDAANDKVTIHGPDVAALERRLATAVKTLMGDRETPQPDGDWESILDLANKVRPFNQAARRERDSIRDRGSDVAVTLTRFDSGTFLEKCAAAADAGKQSQEFAQDFIGFPDPGPATLENQDLRDSAKSIAGDPVNGIPGDALDLVALAEKLPAELEGFTARHDFGDTKYRRVTYQAVATTRFGDCFPSSTASTLDVTRVSDDLVIDVLNTATPPRPRIDYVVPAFAWKRHGIVDEEGFTSERGAGGLRVYLHGPWFLSGEGELLGVAVAFPGASVVEFGDPPNTATTNWARDPLWDTESPFFLPSKGDFRNALDVRLPGGQISRVLGYPVGIDSGRVFCDVTLDPARSYFPFVRLALTRFQPHSIRGRESSAVVLTDFVQLTPKRVVTVQTNVFGMLQIVVAGLTHESATDPVLLGASDRIGTSMRVTVQRRIPGVTDDAGWLPDGPAVMLQGGKLQAGNQVWRGDISMPTGPPGSLRLLIEEIEEFRQSTHLPITREQRIVFAETVPI